VAAVFICAVVDAAEGMRSTQRETGIFEEAIEDAKVVD
jgi:hypothetical protein